MQIEFLWFDDCPNYTAARSLLSEVLAERGIEAAIDDINVPDLESGERVKFAGSPSIRIDGADIEPRYEDSGDYTPRCRVYQTSAGLRGVPEREWIEAAIEAAFEAVA